MKVVLVNHSAVRGGASVVTMRLCEALRQAGVDARMVVGRIEGSYRPEWLAEVKPKALLKANFLIEHALIFAANGFKRENIFKESVATVGMPLHRHPWVKEADVVVLSWVNQGLISLKEIERIQREGKRVVWAMHDMWCFTGVCHHAGQCERFKAECGSCPLICDGKRENDLSRSTLLRKQKLYDYEPITFVAVSHWLGRKALESTLLGSRRVKVIPNVFPVESFGTIPSMSRAEMGLPDNNMPLIVMGAARLDDPIKGLPLAVEVLNKLHDSGTQAMAVFFGDLRDKTALDGLRLPHLHLGPVANAELLRSLYAEAHVVLSTSLYETLPGTLIEGMAAGAWAVTFDRGGQSDIVVTGRTGWIVPFGDIEAMAHDLELALTTVPDRNAQHRAIDSLFGSSSVVNRWIEMLDTIVM